MEDLSHLFSLTSTEAKAHMQTLHSLCQTDGETGRLLSQFLHFSPEQHPSLSSSSVQSPHLNQVQPSFSSTSQQQTAAPPWLSAGMLCSWPDAT